MADFLNAYDAGLIRAILPRYPAEAAKNGIEGRVTVVFDIVRPGIAANLAIVENEPPDVFESDVLDALQYWRFRPAGVGQTTVVIIAETYPETIAGEGYMEYVETFNPVPSKAACVTVIQSASQTFVFQISDDDEPIKLEPLVLDPPAYPHHEWAPHDTMSQFVAAAEDIRARFTEPFVTEILPERMIEPDYPRYWREVGEQGYVTVGFEVSEQGKVKRMRLLEEYPPELFTTEALSSIRRWRFRPFEVGGQAVRRSICQTIEFRLYPAEYFEEQEKRR